MVSNSLRVPRLSGPRRSIVLLLGVIGNYGQILLGDSQWTDVVAFVVLVLVLLIKPTGILGTSLGRSRA